MDENPLQHTKLEGIADYVAAIDTLIGLARRAIRVFDHNLENTGFNSAKRQELLRGFLLANCNNRLQIVVHDPEYLARNCPRMLLLLTRFSHAISIHRTESHAQAVTDPFIVADGDHYARRYHFEDTRGLLALHDPLEAHALNERFGELWEASSPALFATTLGL